MQGFFKSSDLRYKNTQITSPKCGLCKLYQSCNSQMIKVSGEGEKKILIVVENPDSVDDKNNKYLSSKLGRFIIKQLRYHGIDAYQDCWITSAIICHTDEELKDKHINACRPNLLKLIKELQPHVIIPMGITAIHALVKHKFSKSVGGVAKWRGTAIPDYAYNAWLYPTYTADYVKYKDERAIYNLFKADLKNATRLQNKELPAKVLQEEEDGIILLKHPNTICDYLKGLANQPPHLSAFDYETSGLKPHRKGHYIRTASISTDPNSAIAFPFDNKEVQQCFRDYYLRNRSIKKIAANKKFEEVWSRNILDTRVYGWFFDTMIAAHIINNCGGITSLKHQAYVKFGIPDYDSHIHTFLESEGDSANDFNRIDEINLEDLLIYNGIDSMLEFRLALIQMSYIKISYQKYYQPPGE